MLQSLRPHPPIVAAMRSKRADREASSSAAAADEDDDRVRATKRRLHSAEPEAHVDEDEEQEEDDSNAVGSAESRGLRLLRLLLQCAEAVAIDHLSEARDLLPEITELASPFGSSLERVAAYFADALHARILSSFLGTYSPLDSIKSLTLARNHSISQAFQFYNSISPLIKFSNFTANQAIYQALEPEEFIHILDLDIMQGLQWPGLFHILASKPRKLKSLRITGLGSSLQLLEATGRRLADFAAALGLPFEFVPVEGKIGHVADAAVLGPSRDQVTVVHWMHHCLYDVTGSDLGAVRLLRALRPRLVTMVEQDLSHAGDFLGRFVEALHYYSALFDALGDGGGGEGEAERHAVERQLLGLEIRNIVAVGGPKRTGEVKVERWGEELWRLGFRRVSLSGNAEAQASLLLAMYPWKGYTLMEEEGCLKLGWKDLPLLTASAWQPSPAMISGENDGDDIRVL